MLSLVCMPFRRPVPVFPKTRSRMPYCCWAFFFRYKLRRALQEGVRASRSGEHTLALAQLNGLAMYFGGSPCLSKEDHGKQMREQVAEDKKLATARERRELAKKHLDEVSERCRAKPAPEDLLESAVHDLKHIADMKNRSKAIP